MTPRQLAGTLYFARLRKLRGMAETLSLATMAARGKPEKIEQTLKKWERETV